MIEQEIIEKYAVDLFGNYSQEEIARLDSICWQLADVGPSPKHEEAHLKKIIDIVSRYKQPYEALKKIDVTIEKARKRKRTLPRIIWGIYAIDDEERNLVSRWQNLVINGLEERLDRLVVGVVHTGSERSAVSSSGRIRNSSAKFENAIKTIEGRQS